MPNWCSNRLIVSGPSAFVRAVIDLARSDDGKSDFSFDKIIPCPECLHASSAGSDEIHYQIKYGDWKIVASYGWCADAPTESQEAFVAWWKANPPYDKDNARDNSRFDEIADAYKHNVDITGYLTWYQFCTDKWGTKWDASNVDLDMNAPSPVELLSEAHTEKADSLSVTYVFETAWSPPTPVIEELASRFPELGFEHCYIEEGCSFGGRDVYENGIRTSDSSEGTGSSIYELSDWHSQFRSEDSEEGDS